VSIGCSLGKAKSRPAVARMDEDAGGQATESRFRKFGIQGLPPGRSEDLPARELVRGPAASASGSLCVTCAAMSGSPLSWRRRRRGPYAGPLASVKTTVAGSDAGSEFRTSATRRGWGAGWGLDPTLTPATRTQPQHRDQQAAHGLHVSSHPGSVGAWTSPPHHAQPDHQADRRQRVRGDDDGERRRAAGGGGDEDREEQHARVQTDDRAR